LKNENKKFQEFFSFFSFFSFQFCDVTEVLIIYRNIEFTYKFSKFWQLKNPFEHFYCHFEKKIHLAKFWRKRKKLTLS